MAAADGVAVDHGNDGLWQVAYLLLHVEHVEARHAVAAHVATAALDVHVAAGAEGLVAGSRQDDHANVGTLPAIGQRLAHLGHRERGEGVAPAGAVDGDAGYAVVKVEKDFLVFLNGLPIALHE